METRNCSRRSANPGAAATKWPAPGQRMCGAPSCAASASQMSSIARAWAPEATRMGTRVARRAARSMCASFGERPPSLRCARRAPHRRAAAGRHRRRASLPGAGTCAWSRGRCRGRERETRRPCGAVRAPRGRRRRRRAARSASATACRPVVAARRSRRRASRRSARRRAAGPRAEPRDPRHRHRSRSCLPAAAGSARIRGDARSPASSGRAANRARATWLPGWLRRARAGPRGRCPGGSRRSRPKKTGSELRER